MGIFETFSKKRKRLENAAKGVLDVYQYEKVPTKLRNQVVFIWGDAIGAPNNYAPSFSDELWTKIRKTVMCEFGLMHLAGEIEPHQDVVKFFLNKADDEQALDLIGIAFTLIAQFTYSLPAHRCESIGININGRQAIEDLNHRFKENGVGYEFMAGELIRIDSQFIHAEVTRPALDVLSGNAYEGPREEFVAAYKHFRERNYKDTLVDALACFESTMKAIADQRAWQYDKTWSAQKLIDMVFKNKLLPSHVESEFTALRATLESGLPPTRNKQGGHGQGATPVQVPQYIAAYGLHLMATNVLFMIEAHKANP